MVAQEVQATHRRSLAGSTADPSRPDLLALVIAAARSWDDAPGDRRALPPPRGGWARCFEAAAARGYLPRSAFDTSD